MEVLKDIQIWALLAGLGLFLFGMYMLEESLKKLAGRSFKIFLRNQTKNRFKAVFSGALVTAVLQSSSMVVLLVMSFAGAGIIGLRNGIGMIMGTNLGTTFTGWLVSFIGFKLNLEEFILPFLAIGGMGIIFLKSEKLSNWSKLLMGFSLMFLGLSYMKDGFADFSEQVDMTLLHDKPLFLFFIFGYLLTVAIQSSSASIMIFLSSLAAGLISIEQAAFLVIGADLGTTITAIIGTINANTIKRKVGWAQFFFNLFNACITLILYQVYLYFIQKVLNISDPLIVLVSFHTLLNLVGIIIFLPFLGLFANILNRVVRDKTLRISTYLANAIPHEVHAGLESLVKENGIFIQRALQVNTSSFSVENVAGGSHFTLQYEELKRYEEEVSTFYVQLQQNEMVANEVEKVNACISSIRNATLSVKDIKDIRHNLIELSLVTDNQFFQFYQRICENQQQVYRRISILLLSVGEMVENDMENIKTIVRQHYNNEVKEAYDLYSENVVKEISLPTLLNVVRRISGSNDYIIRSILLWKRSNQEFTLKTGVLHED